jgi:hypothetical protein
VEESVNQILNGFRVRDDSIGQPHTASIAEAQHELHALEAAEAEFAFEVRRETASSQLLDPARRAKLAQNLPHDGERLRGNRGSAIGPCPRSAH